MPGRLLSMDQSQDLKKDLSHAQHSSLPPKPDFLHKQTATQVNGPNSNTDSTPLANGVHSSDSRFPTTNGQLSGDAVAVAGIQNPPELDQSWRQGPDFKSMGTLIERLAQRCFSDLDSVLGEMVQSATAHQSGQSNGVGPQAMDTSQASLKNKRKLMEFANDQRDRFVKTLVLSDWARNSDDMAKLIDLRAWQDSQSNATNQAIHFIGVTKHDVQAAKRMNPNIEEALELLATGRASFAPDLGYLPPKRLAAKQLLQTLQNMNVILSTRLNLHEELPPHFDNFAVANGRATFRVDGEFEVDLSVAEEDPASPFYFIDMRFLFSPSSDSLDGVLRAALESKTNEELAAKGLQGCYDFLHNFVLTHKLNVLRDQVTKLLSDKWSHCLSIQKMNRVFTIQYWPGARGRKSWLEIGVGTGKQRISRTRKPPTPRLMTRWFRDGEQVEGEIVDIDWNTLDVERVLLTTIAKHSTWALTSIQNKLQDLAGPAAGLSVHLATSDTCPEHCLLELSLPGLLNPLSLQIEPITGQVSISPPTARVIAAERALRQAPDADLAEVLARLICKIVRDRVDKARELANWQVLPTPIKQESLKSAFGKDFLEYRGYTCGAGWDGQWAVFVTYSLSGELWWIAHLENLPTVGNDGFKAITSARQLLVGSSFFTSSLLTRSMLMQIEKLAVAEVSFAVLSEQLSSLNILYRSERLTSLAFEGSSATVKSLPKLSVFFHGSTLLKDDMGKDFAIDSVRVTHQGFLPQADGVATEMVHEIRLTVRTGRLPHLRTFLATKSRDAEIAMNASNALALKIHARFGQPYLDQVTSRLKACDRLDRYLEIMNESSFKCTSLGFTRVAFAYQNSPTLSAVLVFPSSESSHFARLQLEPAGVNPHRRTRHMLERLFNSGGVVDAFSKFCKILHHSFDLLSALDKIEASHSDDNNLTLQVRSPVLFEMIYHAPLPTIKFEIELRERREGSPSSVTKLWKIGTNKSGKELQESDYGRALLHLAKHRSEHWWGLEDGTLVGTVHGVAEAVVKLDETVRTLIADETTIKGPKASDGGTKVDKVEDEQTPSTPPFKPPIPKDANVPPAPTANMTGNWNSAKVKQEIIEID